MRTRVATIAFAAALAVAVAPGPVGASAQPRVVEPQLPALGKEPAVAELRHFLHSLRARDHASRRVFRALVARKRQLSSAARDALEARDRKRKRYLKAYLAKDRRPQRKRIAEQSMAYYAYLRSVESHRVRQIVARISDQVDRLTYS